MVAPVPHGLDRTLGLGREHGLDPLGEVAARQRLAPVVPRRRAPTSRRTRTRLRGQSHAAARSPPSGTTTSSASWPTSSEVSRAGRQDTGNLYQEPRSLHRGSFGRRERRRWQCSRASARDRSTRIQSPGPLEVVGPDGGVAACPRQDASLSRHPARACERGRLDRSPDRWRVGRPSSGNGGEEHPRVHLPAPTISRRRGDRDEARLATGCS